MGETKICMKYLKHNNGFYQALVKPFDTALCFKTQIVINLQWKWERKPESDLKLGIHAD